jgi:spermidine/putrescine transport system ATP-binding protein
MGCGPFCRQGFDKMQEHFRQMTQIDVALQNVTKFYGNNWRRESNHPAVDNISLEIRQGEFFALLGPSGCGKTTTLRLIAGFEYPTMGDVLIRGQKVNDIPSFHRPVNTVFQDYALFPHMTVLQNVAFGLKMEKLNRRTILERAHEMLDLVQLPNVADRKPSQLSGGQQQRVALARALVKRPAVLLLDEPLGALDLKLRKAMQYELKHMQDSLGITFIYVTHDQEEALVMADRIAVMDEGKVLQVGTPRDIYSAPNDRFVADFIGETNFLMGHVVQVESADQIQVRLAGGDVITTSAGETPVHEGKVIIAIRPEKIAVLPQQGRVQLGVLGLETNVETILAEARQSTDANLVAGTLLNSTFVGSEVRRVIQIGDNGAREQIVVRTPSSEAEHGAQAQLKNGDAVYLFWKSENARLLLE